MYTSILLTLRQEAQLVACTGSFLCDAEYFSYRPKATSSVAQSLLIAVLSIQPPLHQDMLHVPRLGWQPAEAALPPVAGRAW